MLENPVNSLWLTGISLIVLAVRHDQRNHKCTYDPFGPPDYEFLDHSRWGYKSNLGFLKSVFLSMQVCEETRCDEAVFPLAVGILDQFLATCNIKKEQLQMVACVCLLLASKSRQCNHFSLETLSWYTDSSVSVQSLRVS